MVFDPYWTFFKYLTNILTNEYAENKLNMKTHEGPIQVRG